jgi:hypothetical protein
MKKSGIFVTAAALAAVSMSAQAAIKLNATRTGYFLSSAPSVVLPLNDAGATILSFNLPANKKLVLSYWALCTLNGVSGGWVDLDIVVNGVIVVPTGGTNDPLCSVDERSTTGSITIQIQGVAGNNTVVIVGRRVVGASVMQIGNSALLVFD